MSNDKINPPNKKGRTKLSFSNSEINECKDETFRLAMVSYQERVDAFLSEVEARGGITALSKKPNTRGILKARKTGLNNFIKSVKHMREGKGLISDPLLLGAVMKDMPYSLDYLFGISPQNPTPTELTMSAGAMKMIQDAVYNALHRENEYRKQAKFNEKLIGANAILASAELILSGKKKYYPGAQNLLFEGFSCHEHKLFPHLRHKSIEPIDKLIIYNYDNPPGNFDRSIHGALLTIAYVLFEIIDIVNLLIYYTKLAHRNKLLTFEGFRNLGSSDISDLSNTIKSIEKNYMQVIEAFCVQKKVVNIDSLEAILSLASVILKDILKFKFDLISQNSERVSPGKFTIEILTGNNVKIKPIFFWERNNDFIQSFFQLNNLILNQIDCLEAPSKSKILYVCSPTYLSIKNDIETGLSWATAYSDLRSALRVAKENASEENPITINISKGLYKIQSIPLEISSNVHLHGGWIYNGVDWIISDKYETYLYTTEKISLFQDSWYIQNSKIENLTLHFHGNLPSEKNLSLLAKITLSSNDFVLKNRSEYLLINQRTAIQLVFSIDFKVANCHIEALEIPDAPCAIRTLYYPIQTDDCTFEKIDEKLFLEKINEI